MSKLTFGVKHFISRRTTFSRNLHLVEEENLQCLTFYNINITIAPLYIQSRCLWIAEIIFTLVFLIFQESIILSQLQLAYLCYLELSLTVLQNYRMTALVNLGLIPLRYTKK